MDSMVDYMRGGGNGEAAAGGRKVAVHAPATGDWSRNPMIVIWEVTRACALACRHCRAEAQVCRNPLELNRDEGRRLIRQVAEAKPQIFILTGGDPMCRPDLLELIEYATSLGLRVALSPSSTPRWLRADLPAFRQAGIRRVSISIDGSTERSHDAFRGVPGTWQRTLLGIEGARDAGMELQINTTITRENLGEFDGFVRLMDEIEPEMWSVFLLVPTGRAASGDQISGAQTERLFEDLADLSGQVPFAIKTTEGHHFRRVLIQKGKAAAAAARMPGIGDGRGFVFVSHIGEICPSGFLPFVAGNVMTDNLAATYRNSPVFCSLRDPDQLKGKCGRCEFRRICGGSRARAFAMTGDYLAPEPLCVYQPARSGAACP